MIYLINFVVALALSFLTLSFFPYIRVFGVVPLLPVFFLVPLAYYRKGAEPLLIAAFLGFFFDLFAATPFGFYLSYFLFLTLLVRFLFQEGMRHMSALVYMGFITASLVIYYIMHYTVLAVSHVPISARDIIPLLLGVAVNLIFAIITFAGTEWFFEWEKVLWDRIKRR